MILTRNKKGDVKQSKHVASIGTDPALAFNIDMEKRNFKFTTKRAMQYEPLLCAGLCDNCKVPKMVNSGNGINEPLEPVLWCGKKV